jgi:DNA-directed RNA polymerase subunit RPC12/RpoP
MKRRIFWLTVLLVASVLIAFPGCKAREKEKQPAAPAAETKGEPTIAAEQKAEGYWTCPMHPEVKEKGPGKCPICGMKLVQKKVGQGEAAAPEKAQMKVVLTCGMPGHPQFELGKEPADGKCPQCGMKLVKKDVPVKEGN